MNDFLQGARCALSGFRLIGRRGLRRYALIPLLINAALFSVLSYVAFRYFGVFLDWAIPDWLDWLKLVLWPIFALTFAIGGFFLLSLLANLIASPFNALMASRLLAQYLPERAAELVGGNFWQESAQALLNELRKLRYQLIWAAPLLILTFIPGLNLAAPFAWFAFGAWMMAIEYLDFPLGALGRNFPEQRALLRKRRRLSLGYGASVLLLSAVPLLNFIVIPAAVAGACKLAASRLVLPTRATASHASAQPLP